MSRIELVVLVITALASGSAWALWQRLQAANQTIRESRAEIRALQEQQQQVRNDATERKAVEAAERSGGAGAADRLSDSRWVRDD